MKKLLITIPAMLTISLGSYAQEAPKAKETAKFFNAIASTIKSVKEAGEEKEKLDSVRQAAFEGFVSATGNTDVLNEQNTHFDYYIRLARNKEIEAESAIKVAQLNRIQEIIQSSNCTELGGGCPSLQTEVERLTLEIKQLKAKIQTATKGQ
jgi:DNA primase large subunit